MKPLPAVSVLLTAYNREAYIAESIESVLAQRFGDFELLVVDDASTDATAAIAERYAALDRRVRVVVNESNRGHFGNRNHAATFARGTYLKYHDSDDLMYPHCLEIMVGLLAAEPRAGFGLSTGWAWDGGPVPMLLSPREAYEREFMGFGIFMCGPGGGLYRSEVFRALGGWPSEGVHSDTLFLMRALARYSVLLLPADLFWYRRHAGQHYESDTAARDYARLPHAVWEMLRSDACPLRGEQREMARRAHVWSVARHMWRDLKSRRFALARYRLSQSGLTAAEWLRYLRRPARSAAAGTPLDARGTPATPQWVRQQPIDPARTQHP